MVNNSDRKIISTDQIQSFKRLAGTRKIVLVGGCFDVFHYGHLKFLQAAKKQGDILVIALESDTFIQKTKRRKPFHTQSERAQILASLLIADIIFMLPYMKTDEEYYKFTKIVSPHVIAVTRGDTQLPNKRKQARQVGARVVTVTPVVKDFSTTRIIHYATES